MKDLFALFEIFVSSRINQRHAYAYLITFVVGGYETASLIFVSMSRVISGRTMMDLTLSQIAAPDNVRVFFI